MVRSIKLVTEVTYNYTVLVYNDGGRNSIPKFKRQGAIKMAAITLTSENFDKEALRADKPVLVDFWATWCGPCRMVSPIVEELADELDGTVKVGKINVDEQPDLAAKYGVMSIPTLILLKDGQVSATSVGARPKEDIRRQLGI